MGKQLPNFNPELHKEYFKITNELRKLCMEPSLLTWNEYSSILRQLCASLRMSLENGLGEAIRFVADQQRDDDEIRAGVENIFHKKGVFLEFLKIERDVLLKCGVDRATCDEMIDRINGARARIKRIKDVPDADSTIKAIEDLRDSACRMSKEFEWIFQQKKRDYELDKAFLKIYGVGLVIANLSALVLSWGISAAGSSASTGFGSLMVAWDGRLDDPGEEHPKN